MTQWHPATKLLLLAALLVVPYLLWTGAGGSAPGVVASVTRPVPAEAGLPPVEAPPAPFLLPPLERFTEVVERPLFSPSRRMPSPPPPAAPVQVADAPAPEAPAPAGPAEPRLRFFGTVRQGGVAAALVTYPDTAEVGRLRPGDKVGEWEVMSVDGNHLELGLGEERRDYEIFGAGTRGAAPEDAPEGAPEVPPDAAAAPETPSDGADYPDEGNDQP